MPTVRRASETQCEPGARSFFGTLRERPGLCQIAFNAALRVRSKKAASIARKIMKKSDIFDLHERSSENWPGALSESAFLTWK
jgi:hypothetical protein